MRNKVAKRLKRLARQRPELEMQTKSNKVLITDPKSGRKYLEGRVTFYNPVGSFKHTYKQMKREYTRCH